MKKKVKKLHKINSFYSKLYFFLFFMLFIGLGVLIGKGFLKIHSLATKPNTPETSTSTLEIEKMKQVGNPREQSKWYLKLIKRVGPEQAQDELERSGLPHNGNTHLINHTVGNYLYEAYGPAGIVKCKSYFSSSCYHGIIINALGDGDLDEVDKMMKACREAGLGAYGNCVHGLGHGFLTYVGYEDLLEALELCDTMHHRIPDLDSFTCHTGVFMENIWGLHNGEPSPERWISSKDRHYPCSDPRITERYNPACWQNQYTIMSQEFGMNNVEIAAECEKIPRIESKEACFDGLFNNIQIMSNQNSQTQIKDCGQMPPQWINKCLISQVVVGVNHGDMVNPFKICGQIESNDKEKCYKILGDYIGYFTNDPHKRTELCQKMPEQFRARCMSKKE